MAPADTTAPPPDQSLFATLSFFIDEEHLRERLHELSFRWDQVARKVLRHALQTDPQNAEWNPAQNALDPMFNDIAIRDRYSRLDEFLISAPTLLRQQDIDLTIPSVEWETEGLRFKAKLDPPVTRPLTCRTFCYVHGNGAMSYHASFEIPYALGDGMDAHPSFETLYFLAAFQKLTFPKELKWKAPTEAALTGIDLLDYKCVQPTPPGADHSSRPEPLTFPAYIRQRFDALFDNLLHHLFARSLPKLSVKNRKRKTESADPVALDLWDRLVSKAEFIEVPGLKKLPQARGLFLFKDKNFFDLLMARKSHFLECAHTYQPVQPVRSNEQPGIITSSLVETITAPRRVEYYFLSGFFQNIIDFLNQDASEIEDGTDALYPTDPEEQDPFFFRYSNARCLYQVVTNSRSLNIGREFIGTCPYIFFVHLTSFYNEFLIRRYETQVDDVLRKLDSGDGAHSASSLQDLFRTSIIERRLPPKRIKEMEKLVAEFYAFRHEAFTALTRHLYGNIFRYDTERDVFKSVSRIRGVQQRLVNCDKIVRGIDQTITDLRANVRHQAELRRQKSDHALSLFVAVISIFIVLTVLLQAHDLYKHDSPLVHRVARIVMWAAYAAFVVIVALGAWLFGPFLGRSSAKSIKWIKTRRFTGRS